MSSAHANPIKAILLALGANFAIFVAKLVAAIVTGSGAMMAEAVHSLADCGNQALLLLGIRQAKRPPSDDVMVAVKARMQAVAGDQQLIQAIRQR